MINWHENKSTLNIYLDIDGVLLVDIGRAATGGDDFLRTILSKYPESTYWLTTHCWQGENRALDILRPALKPETMELLKRVQPTEWGELKTDAINFSQPFLWFDDDLFPEEEQVLRERGVLSSWIGVDLAKDPQTLIKFIDNFPSLGL